MTHARDVAAGRLAAGDDAVQFGELHKPLDARTARVEAERCFFCYDAPCQQACPTSIDIPRFIREIAKGVPTAAAKTILSANIMGAMCARVCPTEVLCEEACVREVSEGEPVKIGLLQRHATDALFEAGLKPFRRGAPTGRRVAVVGGGPAGLACAHRLAMLGHDVVIFEARPKLGGLNEYGIASYKALGGIVAREIAFILSIGGIEVQHEARLGRDMLLAELLRDFDAVFLGLGLGAVNALGLDAEDAPGVEDAVAWIADLRQAASFADVPVGRRVVVIGGGMTAIDAAVQAKKLGAEEVTIAYRRGAAEMGASRYEQELAQTAGVVIRHWVKPVGIRTEDGELAAVVLEGTALRDGRLIPTGETLEIPCDQLFKAIGQAFVPADIAASSIELEGGRIKVDAERRTSLERVWAGGDCVAGGRDLTVAAVEDGKRAAIAIDRALRPALAQAAE